MKKHLLYFTIVILLVGIQSSALAQRRDWSGPWAIGMSFGGTSYIGDLNEPNGNRLLIVSQSLSFASAAWLSKDFGPLTLVGQMNIGRLQSRDYNKDLLMRASFYEYSGNVRVNINRIIEGRRYRLDKWHFYLVGGIGMIRYSSNMTDMPQDTLINSVGYASIGRGFSYNFGAGIQYYITEDASIHIGADYHMLNIDDIDAYIKGSDNDAYTYVSIGFSYAFGRKRVGGGRRKSLLWGKY